MTPNHNLSHTSPTAEEIKQELEGSPEREDNRIEQERDEADIDMRESPDGGRQYNARLHSGGEDNVVQVNFDLEGNERVMINGGEVSDPATITKVNMLFEINDNLAEKSSEGHALETQSNETAERVKHELEEQGADSSDQDMIERRTSQMQKKVREQQGDNRASDEQEQTAERAMLAERLMDKDRDVANALADALREAGDDSGAQQLEQLAYEAGQRVGGIEQIENEDTIVQLFGKKAQEAMEQTGKTVEELEDDAAEKEDGENERAA